ncbi:peptidoglycan-binding domain-containing protein [Streptomyces sp. NRRL S-350]|uniref:peptidoglycan-binding domain-containing protein n=1 Tax=Streptomyces sp. NRRL S-350 TaxID=1463902 RepID=UPI000691C900|nr:peptidoglycan-binding domain-containing protein [Streptomyces sp. NRRL S-350]
MRKILGALAVTGLILGGGIATAGTASAATPNSSCSQYSTSEPLLKAGATGDAVKALQCELNLSINPSDGYGLDRDGVFGQATLRAVQKFQACTGLSPDGEVGPLTWSKLDYWSNASGWAC